VQRYNINENKMSKINIVIDFKRYVNHLQLINDLSPVFEAKKNDIVSFIINFNSDSGLIYSDFLTIIYASVEYLRNKGIEVQGEVKDFQNDDRMKYVSRVNFFKLIGLKYDEKFARKSSTGKFTEIERFDKNTYITLQNYIFDILNNDKTTELNVKAVFSFCLNEILDNVLNHSALPQKFQGYGFCSAQLFPNLNEIRIVICDTGIGIKNALMLHPDGIYNNITNEEALQMCIHKGITNKEGRGFGLYATSEFIKDNKGEILLYSGNNYLYSDHNEIIVREGSNWQGAIVFLKIKTNQKVDYSNFMKGFEHINLEEDFKEKFEDNIEINENLW